MDSITYYRDINVDRFQQLWKTIGGGSNLRSKMTRFRIVLVDSTIFNVAAEAIQR